jgi:hypothetical protein
MNTTIPIHSATGAERYFNPHQARTRAPTLYEDQLGDALERAFAAGRWELDAVVEQLNQSGPSAPNGAPWTQASLQATLAQLAQ